MTEAAGNLLDYDKIIASPREKMLDGPLRKATIFVKGKAKPEVHLVHTLSIDQQTGALSLILTASGVPTAIVMLPAGQFTRVNIEPYTVDQLRVWFARQTENAARIWRNSLRDEAEAFERQEQMMRQRIAQKNRWVGLQEQLDGPETLKGHPMAGGFNPDDDERGGSGSVH